VTGNNFALGICVDAGTKLALERAAAAEGMSVAQYIETALSVLLADGGYIQNGEKRSESGTSRRMIRALLVPYAEKCSS
jgi:hypothetical protein